MATLTIESHKAVTVLKKAGYTEKQAEAVVAVFEDVQLNDVATKNDVTAVKEDLMGFKTEFYKVITAQTIIIIAAVVGLLQLLD